MCPPDWKIKYSVFYNICRLIFMYYTVCYFTGIFRAVVRQISVLFIDNKVLCVLQYMCTYIYVLYCVILLVFFMQS